LFISWFLASTYEFCESRYSLPHLNGLHQARELLRAACLTGLSCWLTEETVVLLIGKFWDGSGYFTSRLAWKKFSYRTTPPQAPS